MNCILTIPFSSSQTKELPTFKDNDFLNDGASIHIGADSKEKLMAMLKSDVEVTLKTESLTFIS